LNVPGKPFKPSLIFTGEAGNHLSGSPYIALGLACYWLKECPW